jgi:hypothetical protein
VYKQQREEDTFLHLKSKLRHPLVSNSPNGCVGAMQGACILLRQQTNKPKNNRHSESRKEQLINKRYYFKEPHAARQQKPGSFEIADENGKAMQAY